MLELTVSSEPPTPPALIVQAPAQSLGDFSKTVIFCRDKESLMPDSGRNGFSPLSAEFLRQIGAKHGLGIHKLKQYRVTLIAPPQHGKVRLTDEPSRSWTYKPKEGYTGADRVIYQVENQDKRYKVILNLWVVEIIDEGRRNQECDSINFGVTSDSVISGVALTSTAADDLHAWARAARFSVLLGSASFR